MNFSRIVRVVLMFCFALAAMPVAVMAQTNCDEGTGPLNTAQPQGLTPQQIIETMSIPRTLPCRNWTAAP
jgi:hypothetical protein